MSETTGTGLQERLSRLRRLGLRKGTAHLQLKKAPLATKRGPGIKEVVDGQMCSTPLGTCFVARETWALSHCHGDLPLTSALQIPPVTLARLAGLPDGETLDLRQAVFFDVETLGLSGGTGTYVFLTGVGFFEGDSFCLHQFFMQDVAQEGACLYATGELLDRFDTVVSFNGRSFDLPRLNTRFTLARQPRRLVRAPHLDLLRPSRRLWGRRLASCALGSLEQEVLGVCRSEAEVPGWLVPRLYFDYVQTGDATELAGVFYHNLMDVLSLVTLAARLGTIFDDPQATGSLDGMDLFSLGLWYESLGMMAESEAAYCAALSRPLPGKVEGAAWQHLSLLLKRQDRRQDAVAIWGKVAENGEKWGIFAHVELAKHYEWYTGDLSAAALVTRQAMGLLESALPDHRTRETLNQLTHRLRRLERKMAQAISKT
jgi:uncharacterized protein YprB with RNaseH-like and TPR domain